MLNETVSVILKHREVTCKFVWGVKTFLHRFVVCILKECQQRNVSSTKSISTAAAATTMVEQKQEEGGGVGKFCNCIFNEFWQDKPRKLFCFDRPLVISH